MQDWPALDHNIVICIEQLELAPTLLQDDSIQKVFVMYNFLPQFCDSIEQQCTQTLAKQQGIMHFNHTVVRRYAAFYPECLSQVWAIAGPNRTIQANMCCRQLWAVELKCTASCHSIAWGLCLACSIMLHINSDSTPFP